jgi:hypothetical protein
MVDYFQSLVRSLDHIFTNYQVMAVDKPAFYKKENVVHH